MSMKFDPTKLVEFRDGTPCRIICTDKKAQRSIVFLGKVTDAPGGVEQEVVNSAYPNGRVMSSDYNSPKDLVNKTTNKKMFMNIYRNAAGGYRATFYTDQIIARRMSVRACVLAIAVPVEWEEVGE